MRLILVKLIVFILRLVRFKKRAISKYPLVIFDARKRQTFFGYYDYSPFDQSGKRILAVATDSENVPLTEPVELEVGYFFL